MNHTPDQVRQSIVHVLDEWANGPDTTGMSAFAAQTGLSKTDRIDQRYTISELSGDQFDRRRLQTTRSAMLSYPYQVHDQQPIAKSNKRLFRRTNVQPITF